MELRDAVQRLEVSISSPDRCVTIVAAGSPARITVSLAQGCTRTHTEESLLRHINGAARVAMRAYQQSVTEAWATAAGITPDGSRDSDR